LEDSRKDQASFCINPSKSRTVTGNEYSRDNSAGALTDKKA
jgi:hypothetical protein